MVKGIEMCNDDEDLCEIGCSTLTNIMSSRNIKQSLSCFNKQVIIPNTVNKRSKVRTVEEIKTIVKTIYMHIENAGVCESGCGALGNMIDTNCEAFAVTTIIIMLI